MRFWKALLPLLVSSLCLGAQSDRISGTINSSQVVALTGNVHGLAQSRFDLGSTGGAKTIHGVTLVFHPSATQQADLENLLAQQQDRSSPNFHKWLTPAQFADRFGMSQNDIAKVSAWLESEGFTVASVANSRNQISFDGTVAQLESVFRTEIHTYLVDGETHFANATNPSVPAAMAGSVMAVGHLHDFRPRPHVRVQSHFTSSISGSHFLTPGDFATIYDLQPLYSAGIDGTGQTIAIMGQTAIYISDIDNFRSSAGLSTNLPTQVLVPGSGTSTVSTSDLVEADLDLEWSNGVAKNATVIYVYVGNNSNFSVWNSLQYAVDNNVAPVISISYGDCEAGNGKSFDDSVQGWAQQGNSQGQTIVAASGDDGAADCDYQVSSATKGLAVDVPAAIPEVTGMGGNEFFGDSASTSTTAYWEGASGSDTISSALSYIPEEAWNDTAEDGTLSASGGGASIYFSKPTWQTGIGVPADGKRDVPDLALSASPDHDGYLICSQTDGAGYPSCTSGFRDSNSDLDVVGGTSAAAPTFAAIVALLNQYLTASGLGNVNVNLYALAASNPSALHDVTTGNNIVPCTSGTTGCPAKSPFQYGFTAGTGYDQVTGLGSVDGYELAQVWAASRSTTTTTVSASSSNIYQGASVTFTAAVTPSTSTGKVSFYNNGSTTALGTATVSSGKATFSTTALPAGADSVMAVYDGNGSTGSSTSATPAVVNVATPFTMSANPTSASVSAGQTATFTITITPITGFTGAVSFTASTTSSAGSCSSGLPTGALCSFNPASVTLDGIHAANVTLTITTMANMTLPTGAQSITVTGTSGTSGSNSTPVSLTVTASTETFTLSTTASTFPVAVGGTAAIPITVNSTNGFINTSNNTTILPLTYSCTGIPTSAEISCQLPNSGQPSSAPSVTLSLVTTPTTTQLRPFGPSRIFYALLLPGLFGMVFAAGSRTRAARLLGLIVVLGCSTLWLGACSGGSGTNTSLGNPGTPAGQYTVTITATTGGANPISNALPPITLTVQ
jgi:hypothetical protein